MAKIVRKKEEIEVWLTLDELVRQPLVLQVYSVRLGRFPVYCNGREALLSDVIPVSIWDAAQQKAHRHIGNLVLHPDDAEVNIVVTFKPPLNDT